MRELEVSKNRWEGNSMTRWFHEKNPFVVCLNFLVIYACRYLPSLAAKRFLYELIGVKVGKNASIGLGATIDIFFPELLEIGENSVIGYNATILCHEFLVSELRKGKVKIGKNVMIGANSTILAGVVIGDDAIISAMSLVNRDVKKGEKVCGVPIKEME